MTGPHPAVAATRSAVREALDGHEFGARVWVACSGGPDSLALAAAASFVGHKQGYLVGAIVVDHGLQENSAAISERAAAQAAKAGIATVFWPSIWVPSQLMLRRVPGASASSAAWNSACEV